MNSLESGLQQGAGIGCGLCSIVIIVPAIVVLLGLYSCASAVDSKVGQWDREAKARQDQEIIRLAQERDALLAVDGSPPPPLVDTSSAAAVKKQMRIEGIDPDAKRWFPDRKDQEAARKPLEMAANDAKVGAVDGQVLMLDELSGVVKGDLIDDVMQRFDAPDHRGFTNDVHHFSQAWPDMNYYSYESADVTFLTYAGRVELILVGLTYRDASRRY